MITIPICDFANHVDPNWNTVVQVIQPEDDIPIPNKLDELFLDFETTSENPKISSVNPHAESLIDETLSLHRNCKICGVAFLFDNEPIPYYIPVRHAYLDPDDDYCYRTGINEIRNVQPEKVYDWLKKILWLTKKWVNHQIKYDYHVLYNETGLRPPCQLVCTIILSKLAQFQERFSYDLTEMLQLLGIDISPYEQKIHNFLGKTLKDYGLIPPDHMAQYAGVDVLCDRFLYRALKDKISPGCKYIEEMELKLLPILIQMEQIGCRVDVDKLRYDWERLIPLQINRVKRIKEHADFPQLIISGEGSKNSVKEMFTEHLGWSFGFTEGSKKKLAKNEMYLEDANFSFSADSVRKHGSKNPRLVASYLAYQDDKKLLSSYTQPILESHTSSFGLIHCTVNQQLRTGRMSVTQPGMQTLPPKAKYYIIPYTEDYVLVNFDLSQIEFRVIIHYIQNPKALKAYRDDPNTDFHIWIADMCKLDRKPAKTCNFLLGYGGGKQHFFEVLSEYLRKKGGFSGEHEILGRAHQVYDTYHGALPELKPTSYRAGDVVRHRGFVRTLLGRERYIDKRFFYKAFNSVCQGTAADIQKDITVRLKPLLGRDCLLHMLVHDSWLFSIRKERVKELVPLIQQEIDKPIEGFDFSVPIRSKYGISEKNWRMCDE